MVIQITDGMRRFAREHDNRINNRVKGTVNYTGYATKDSFYYGTLAECIFIKALYILGKQADYLPPAGRPDDEDVVVHLLNSKTYNINVKCATQPNHKFLVLYPKQLEKYNYRNECYVGVRLEGDVGRIMGFFYKHDLEVFKFAENEDERYRIFLDHLRPLDQMLDKIADGDTRIQLPY